MVSTETRSAGATIGASGWFSDGAGAGAGVEADTAAEPAGSLAAWFCSSGYAIPRSKLLVAEFRAGSIRDNPYGNCSIVRTYQLSGDRDVCGRVMFVGE
jgi:hypothetical protein